MHRATPLTSSFRAYTGGGARSAVNQADDSHLMQESAGNFMAGEARQAIESPQNYGFTSVVMDAIQGAAGQASQMIGQFVASAESMISFMGSNRSFPVAGVMDDRRHRLNGLDKGDTGMFGTQGRMQQIQTSSDGLFASAPNDKTFRMAVIDDSSQQDMTSQSFQSQQASGGGNLSAAAVNDRDYLERDEKGVPTHFVHVDRKGVRHRFRRIFPLNISNYSHVVPIPTPFDTGARRRRRRWRRWRTERHENGPAVAQVEKSAGQDFRRRHQRRDASLRQDRSADHGQQQQRRQQRRRQHPD